MDACAPAFALSLFLIAGMLFMVVSVLDAIKGVLSRIANDAQTLADAQRAENLRKVGRDE